MHHIKINLFWLNLVLNSPFLHLFDHEAQHFHRDQKNVATTLTHEKTQRTLFGVHPQNPKKTSQKTIPNELTTQRFPSPISIPGWKPWRYPHNSTPIVVYKPATCKWHLGLVDGMPNGFGIPYTVFVGSKKESCVFRGKKHAMSGSFRRAQGFVSKSFLRKKIGPLQPWCEIEKRFLKTELV